MDQNAANTGSEVIKAKEVKKEKCRPMTKVSITNLSYSSHIPVKINYFVREKLICIICPGRYTKITSNNDSRTVFGANLTVTRI